VFKRMNLRAIAIPVAMTGLLAIMVTYPSAASAGTGILKNSAEQKCMTNGGDTANSAPITQYTCDGLAQQSWSYPGILNTTGTGTIVNEDNGKCLTDGGSTANSAPITQYTCNGSPNQVWTTTVQGLIYGPITISNSHGMCMTDGGSPKNSAPITQYKCNGSANQNWLM